MTSGPNNDPKDTWAHRIAGGLLRTQVYLSGLVNRVRGLHWWLGAFCLGCFALSVWVMVRAVWGKPGRMVRPEPVQLPASVRPERGSAPAPVPYNAHIPHELYQRIQAFKRYMDSTGQEIPRGMADSIRMLEKIFIQQQKEAYEPEE